MRYNKIILILYLHNKIITPAQALRARAGVENSA